jgi:hypothetical protein
VRGPVTIAARITGAATMVGHLRGVLPAEARTRLRTTIESLGFRLQRLVQADYLSGQVLNVRSGRLRRSINTRLRETPGSVTASVGTSVSYGRFWELGFHGIEHVAAYTRRVSGRDVRGAMEGHTRKRLTAMGLGYVRAHDRRVDVGPRPFLRRGLEAMSGTIRNELALAMRGL